MKNSKRVRRILRAHIVRQYKRRPRLFGPLHPAPRERIRRMLIGDLDANKPEWLKMGPAYYKEWLRLYLVQVIQYRHDLHATLAAQ